MGNVSSHLPSRNRYKKATDADRAPPPTAIVSSIGFDAVHGVPIAASPLHVGVLDATSPYADRDMRYEWKVSYGAVA